MSGAGEIVRGYLRLCNRAKSEMALLRIGDLGKLLASLVETSGFCACFAEHAVEVVIQLLFGDPP
ncbi:MAG TPA: hypothetical protein VM186_09660 [Planctomycetota bacterium]|nr:hypothetical protein [Planctomycetota bacterium]